MKSLQQYVLMENVYGVMESIMVLVYRCYLNNSMWYVCIAFETIT